jgi:hypothetical protein
MQFVLLRSVKGGWNSDSHVDFIVFIAYFPGNMTAPLRVSYAVSLPLPADFALQPLLQNDRLAAIASHRFLYAGMLFVAFLYSEEQLKGLLLCRPQMHGLTLRLVAHAAVAAAPLARV